jgi:hypothetical protein
VNYRGDFGGHDRVIGEMIEALKNFSNIFVVDGHGCLLRVCIVRKMVRMAPAGVGAKIDFF